MGITYYRTGAPAMPPVNYDRIRHAGDGHVMPEGFRADQDTGQYPGDTVAVCNVRDGAQVIDASGQRFRVLAQGPMQGATLMRDSRRQMFYYDCQLRVKVTGR